MLRCDSCPSHRPFNMAAKKRSWKYMVFTSRCLLEFIGEGTGLAFGILMPRLTEQLGSSSATTGFLVSFHLSLWYLAAPLAQLLVDHCSQPRIMTTVCGFFTGLFIVATAFTKNVALFGFFLVSSALCASVLHRQVLLLLHVYFPSNFAYINTATFFGAIIGGLALPQLTALSLMAYGVSGALLVLGGINLNMMVAGYALKVPKGMGRSDDSESDDTIPLITKQEGAIGGVIEGASEEDIEKPTAYWSDSTNSTKKNMSHDNPPTEEVDIMNIEEETKFNAEDSDKRLISRNHQCKRDNPSNYSGKSNQRNQSKYVNGPVESNDGCLDSDNGFSKSKTTKKGVEKEARSLTILHRLKEIARIDFLIKNPLVSLTLIPSCGMINILIGGSDFFEVTYGLSQGLETRAANCIPIASVSGCAVSQILLTIVLHYRPSSCAFVFLSSCCLSTLGFFLITLYSSFWYILMMSFVIGLGINGAIITCDGVVDFVVEEEDFADGSTLADLSGGLGFLLSGFIAGYIKDITGNMKTVFCSLGAMNLLTCFLMVVLVCKVSCTSRLRNE